MKWILLLAIFAIGQYEGVKGDSEREYPEWYLHKETQAPLEVPDKDLDRSGRLVLFPFMSIHSVYNNTLIHIKKKLESLETAYQQIISQLKDLVASLKGDKNKPSTPENITSSSTTQKSATQTSPTLDKSTVNQKSTPSQNDDKEEKQKDKKDTLEPITSNKKDINVAPLTTDNKETISASGLSGNTD